MLSILPMVFAGGALFGACCASVCIAWTSGVMTTRRRRREDRRLETTRLGRLAMRVETDRRLLSGSNAVVTFRGDW